MNKNISVLLGLSLLLASCGSQAPSYSSVTPPVPSDTLPDVPRPAPTSGPNCTTAEAPLSSVLFSPTMRDRGERVRLAQPQATGGNIYSLLATTKTLLNKHYYGYSSVDLDALHSTNFNNFKTVFPNNLRTYNLIYISATQSSEVDDLMSSYVDGVNDKHTFYMNAEATKQEQTGGSAYADFGATINLVPKGDGLLITDVRLNSPAQKAGLKRGDVIMSVNGTALTRKGADDTTAAKEFATVYYTAATSKKDTALVVQFAGTPRTVTLAGEVLTGTNMPWGELRTENGKKHYYLRIPTFMSVAPEQTDATSMPIALKVHQLVAEAQTLKADDIVIDLRDNGGGLLVEFVGAAGTFAPKVAGETLRAIDGSGMTLSYNDGAVMYQINCGAPQQLKTLDNTLWTGKVAVLVNGNSASSSEMFSANMQAAGIKVIGTNTYGVAGTSTNHFDLPGSRSISITTGRTYVNNKAVAEYITPDIQSADDLAQLAATGVDNTVQVAYDALK